MHPNDKQVDFSSITSTTTGELERLFRGPPRRRGGFSQLPFSFIFEGSYFDLEHLFNQLASFATLDSSGNLQVNGRLLTIQSVHLAPVSSGSQTGKSSALTGTITATAYVLPGGQGVTGTTGAASPTGAAASPASSSATSSPTSPAIVRVNP